MSLYSKYILVIAAMMGAVVGAAWGQVVAPPPSIPIDMHALVNAVVWPIVGAIVSALTTWISIKVAKLLGLKSDNEVRRYLEPALQNALAYGQQVTDQLPLTFETKNAIVAEAANFAIKQVPDGLAALGIDKASVTRMLTARLEANVSAQTAQVTATASAPMPTAVSVAKPGDQPPVAG